MVIGDARFDGLVERVEVGVVFGDVFAEQRLFQRDDRLRSLDDVACVAECVVGVVDMQSEIVEIVRFECSFVCAIAVIVNNVDKIANLFFILSGFIGFEKLFGYFSSANIVRRIVRVK